MSRGQIFSIDAALGTSLVVLILWATLWEMNFPSILPELQIVRMANDVLDVKIADGTLLEFDDTALEESLSDLLPQNYDYRLVMRSYGYSGGFSLLDSFSIGDDLPIGRQDPATDTPLPFKFTRTFLTFQGNEIETYNEVEMWVWLK